MPLFLVVLARESARPTLKSLSLLIEAAAGEEEMINVSMLWKIFCLGKRQQQ